MKKTLLGILILIYSSVQAQQTYADYNWAKSFGGANHDFANIIQSDLEGNMIVVGRFSDSTNFEHETLYSVGEADNFIAKFDFDGNLIWVKSIGNSSEDDRIISFTTDQAGNIYLVGNYRGSLDLNPNNQTYTVTEKGNSDIFVIKLDKDGSFVWGGSIGGTAFDNAAFIKLDNQNQIYITGTFNGTADFNLHSGEFNLSTSETSMFILKMDQNGNPNWVKKVQKAYGRAIAINSNQEIYVAGLAYNSLIDFDPSDEGTYNLESWIRGEGSNAFILKLNQNGEFIHAGITSRANDNTNNLTSVTPVDIVLDSEENVYLAGHWYGDVDFDFGDESYPLSSLYASAANSFVIKMDENLSFDWMKYASEYVAVRAHKMVIDAEDNIYLSGYSQGGATFDNSPYTVYTANSTYVASLNTSGEWTAAFDLAGGENQGYVAVDVAGNLYVAGYFVYHLFFGIDPTHTNYFYLPNPDENFREVFLLKIGENNLPDIVNSPPVASDQSFDVVRGQSTDLQLSLNVYDIDNNLDLSSIVITQNPANGSIIVNENGSVTYVHNNNELTSDEFKFTMSDEEGLTSNVATVQLIILPALGNNELDDLVKVKIYPNPANDFITINQAVKSVQIVDLSGRIVLISTSKTIDVSSLNSGIYLMNIVTNKGQKVTSKLIKK